jgi:CheY-like chemotaxis protein
VLTADATAAQRERIERLSGTAYLTKPIGVGRLLEAIDLVLDQPAARPPAR